MDGFNELVEEKKLYNDKIIITSRIIEIHRFGSEASVNGEEYGLWLIKCLKYVFYRFRSYI